MFTHVEYDWPMNYAGPLLLECGFKASKQILTKSLDRLGLLKNKKAECIRRYIQDYLENPQRIAVMSRNTIRRYYKGRSLHSFLRSITCPNKIKDFILLKHLFPSEVTPEALLKDMDIYNMKPFYALK